MDWVRKNWSIIAILGAIAIGYIQLAEAVKANSEAIREMSGVLTTIAVQQNEINHIKLEQARISADVAELRRECCD